MSGSAFRGRVIWITGASGGIGRAAAELLAGEGARLALGAHRGAGKLEAWLAGRPWRERAAVFPADVTDESALERCAREITGRWGRLDGCVASAGVWPPDHAPLATIDPRRVREVLEVNLLGALWTCRAFLRAAAGVDVGGRGCAHDRGGEIGPDPSGGSASGSGDADRDGGGGRDRGSPGGRENRHASAGGDGGRAIVLIGSTAGKFGEAGHVAYSASKAALHGVMLTLKNELTAVDPLGRINLVEPGWTATPMARPGLADGAAVARTLSTMALRRIASASDVAHSIAFLLDPLRARHLSGQVLTVAGGMEGRLLWEPSAIDADAVRAEHGLAENEPPRGEE